MYLLPNYIATCKSPSPQDAAIVGTRVDTVTHVRVYHHRISFRSQPTAKPYASMILTARLRECDIECPRTRARRRMARSAVCGPSCALLYQRGTYTGNCAYSRFFFFFLEWSLYKNMMAPL